MISTYHRLSNVDYESGVGTCSRCGEGIKLKGNGRRPSGVKVYRCPNSQKGEHENKSSDGIRAWCSNCQRWKSVFAFGLDGTKNNGLNNVCRFCRFETKVLGEHNLTVKEYNKILEDQGGTCAIRGCLMTNESDLADRRMAIDHDHACCPGRASCGKCVRGILCNMHNRTLGFANDNIDELKALIEYLEVYSEKSKTKETFKEVNSSSNQDSLIITSIILCVLCNNPCPPGFYWHKECLTCVDCGKRVRSLRCASCTQIFYHKQPTKIDWPALNELTSMLAESNYFQLGKTLGVTSSTIKKHIKNEKKRLAIKITEHKDTRV